MKAEYWSINNIKLNGRQIKILDNFQTKDQNIFEGDEEAKESRNKVLNNIQKRKWTSDENLWSLTIKITIN